jgi:N-acetylglucosaminyldiphosphoundecaprenol N-acetyl-beta-D-mannosaminyltransferase
MRPHVLGVQIDTLSAVNALRQIERWLANPEHGPYRVYTPNPEMLVYAHRHPEFKTLLNEGDLNLPDGIGLVWFSHDKIHERIAGTDLVQRIVKEHPAVSIGCVIPEHGLSTAADIQSVLPRAEVITPEQTFQSEHTLILVALGSPAQEQWIHEHAQRHRNAVLWGVGASLDHLTGKQRRAPLIFQRIRLEWLWRLFRQPRRFKRILTATIYFPLLALTRKS